MNLVPPFVPTLLTALIPALALPAAAERVESVVLFDGTPTAIEWLKAPTDPAFRSRIVDQIFILAEPPVVADAALLIRTRELAGIKGLLLAHLPQSRLRFHYFQS